MAAEAEAGRAARAKVIAADGEMRASKALSEASGVIEKSPAAIQLRHLQVNVKILLTGCPEKILLVVGMQFYDTLPNTLD